MGRRRSYRTTFWIVSVCLAAVLFLYFGPNLAPGESASPRFVNIAPRGMAASTQSAESGCFGDVDGDGDQDLFVPSSDGMSRLWLNDGSGVFTDSGALDHLGNPRKIRFMPIGCAFFDADSDGDPDLYVSARNRPNQRGSLENKFFRNDGGRLTDITQSAGVGMRTIGTASSDWADFDGDGDYDGFVAARWGGRPRQNALFRQGAPLSFTDVAARMGVGNPEGPPRPFLGSWFDYDGDGDLDLLLAIDFWGVELYRNDGSGFSRVTTAAMPPAADTTPGAPPNNPMGVTWGDYDNDGCIDVFITGTNLTGQGGIEGNSLGDLASRLYRNNCDGTLTDVTIAAGLRPTGVVEWAANFIDFDNDGDLDLSVVAGNVQQEIPKQKLLALARRFFSAAVTIPRRYITPERAAALYRYEAMIPASGARGLAAAMPNYLYQNQLVETGKPTFVDVTSRVGAGDMGATRGSAWADIDNDGDLDWFVPNRLTPSRLYRNDGPVGQYLRVHLVGVPLRDAVGAWVKVKVGGGVQMRHVHVLDGYLSQSQMDPHFGLGRAQRVDEIWVRWAGETIWRLECTGVAANRMVTITRGAGCR